MNSSDIPVRILKPFAVNGDKNEIPVDSSPATLNNGEATFDSGFPPVTMQPINSGGIPPSGKDMNGVLFSVSQQQQWYTAGMGFPFDLTYSTSIGGYPRGALIPSSSLTGQWINLNEGNTTPPESPTGANTGWAPTNNYGITTITGLSSASIVMSSLQAAKDRIVLSGTLTANINLIFPAWIKSWVVQNNCTGNFSVTCRTASGTGVIVIPGMVSRIFCDSVNITDETMSTMTDLVGSILPFAMNSAPQGWLAANGQLVSRNIYARLFSRIGTLYGTGDGSTTFAVPDLRGEFLRGFDAGRGIDSGRVFGSSQGHSIQKHNHYMPTSTSTPSDNTYGIDDNVFIKTKVNQGPAIGYDSTTYPNPLYESGDNVGTIGTFTTETRPRNIAMLYCIKY